VVCAPLLLPVWLGGHEGPNYLHRTAEFAGQLAQGEPWPRWCPDFYWGYGYPFFVFYPPGVFYLAAPLVLAGVGVVPALKVGVVLGCLLLFFGVRRLALLYVHEGPARLAAVLAATAGWRFVQVYVRGDIAEALATSLLPWLFAEAVLVARSDPGLRRWPAARLALLLASIGYVHTLSAVFACWCLGAIGLWRLVRHRDPRGCFRVAAASGLGLVVAAGYLVPAWFEQVHVRTHRMLDRVDENLSFAVVDHLVAPWQRLVPSFRFGASTPGTGDGMTFADTPLFWLVLGAVVGLAVARPLFRRQVAPWLLAWLVINLMVSPAARPVWPLLPLGDWFQFPWRLLRLEGLLIGMMAALVDAELTERPPPVVVLPGLAALAVLGSAVLGVDVVLRDWLPVFEGLYLDGWPPVAHLAVVGLVLALAASPLLDPCLRRGPALAAGLCLVLALPLTLAVTLKATDSPTPVSDRDLAAFGNPALIQGMDLIDAAGRRLPITTAGRDEYLPRTVAQPPRARPGSEQNRRPARDLGPAAEQSGAWRRWYVTQDQAALREATWFVYPGVVASVDGASVEISHDAAGLVQVQVPAGAHVVDVWYGGTAWQRAGLGVALVGLLILAALVFLARPSQRHPLVRG
jgi:hypothetical protein